jgi:hypothetical protein
VARHAQLTDQKHLQRGVQRTGNFKSDRHASARESHYENTRAVGISDQFAG